MLAGTTAIISGCGQNLGQSILNMQAVYGPPPALEEDTPATNDPDTLEQMLEDIFNSEFVYGPPPGSFDFDPKEFQSTLDEVFPDSFLYYMEEEQNKK